MKIVREYWQLLEYLNRIGFGGSPKDPIGYRQMMLCKVADSLIRTAGGLPFSVTAHELRDDRGRFFPWLCKFEIRMGNGGRRFVRPANLVR